MAIFLFNTRDGNVDVSPAALPQELEIAVARATSRWRPFLASSCSSPPIRIPPTLGGMAQVREIQVVLVQRGA